MSAEHRMEAYATLVFRPVPSWELSPWTSSDDAALYAYEEAKRGRFAYLPQRFKTALVTASRTASWRMAH
jgi:hypothetical protein